jgi:protease I
MTTTFAQRVLFVISPEKFRDEELFESMSVLENAGIVVDVASTRVGEAVGDLGGRFLVRHTLSEVVPSDYAFIGVIGGSGTAEHLWDDASVRSFVVRAAREAPGYGAICAGSVVLARAGLLQGTSATTYPAPALIDALEAAGAVYSPENVVVVGRLITADGPQSARAFGEAILRSFRHEALAKEETHASPCR